MFKEQAILGNADAALMRKCGFNSVRVERVTRGSAYEVQKKDGRRKGLPMVHTGGELIFQEQMYGEGDGDIRIRLQFRAGSLVRVEVRSSEQYQEACQEWAIAVRSALPEIEIVFLEREN